MMKQNGTECKQLMNLATGYTGVLCSMLFLINLFIYLFIFGCAGSSLLCAGFL